MEIKTRKNKKWSILFDHSKIEYSIFLIFLHINFSKNMDMYLILCMHNNEIFVNN